MTDPKRWNSNTVIVRRQKVEAGSRSRTQHGGFAAVRAESLWLSVIANNLLRLCLRRRSRTNQKKQQPESRRLSARNAAKPRDRACAVTCSCVLILTASARLASRACPKPARPSLSSFVCKLCRHTLQTACRIFHRQTPGSKPVYSVSELCIALCRLDRRLEYPLKLRRRVCRRRQRAFHPSLPGRQYLAPGSSKIFASIATCHPA